MEDITLTEVNSSEDCSICLKVPKEKDIIHKLPCKHIFHKACIVEWLSKINTCPLCRSQFPKETFLTSGSLVVQNDPNIQQNTQEVQTNNFEHNQELRGIALNSMAMNLLASTQEQRNTTPIHPLNLFI